MASPARDIPKPSGQDSFAGIVARSVPVPTSKLNHPLPTPPNSISPSLPPHGLKARASASAAPVSLDQIDSDLDLHDLHDLNAGSLSSQHGFESAGAITSALLAKHHLPEILLVNGPLAIRHIMGYLTTSVPGFSGIPPAKARRLVVGALEGRGSGGEGGGVNGDVKFEKVGWGRWDARLKGQLPRDTRGAQHSPPPSVPSSYSVGMPIMNNNTRPRPNAPSSSWAGESAVFSHNDDMDITMPETEADKMSLDGDESCSSSEAPPEDELMGDDPEDITDDEDWAAVGAAALRQASYPASKSGNTFLSTHVYTAGSRGGGGQTLPALGKSAPVHFQSVQHNIDYSAYGMASDSQEREAIEALLRLGSV
jgi:Putative Sin3 binding protein